MGERNLVHTPTPTMRAGVLEPLEQLDTDNCLPIQAVIVKNGKIFIDSIEAVVDGSSDENRLLEDEIDSLTGGVDDDYIDSNKFSQEAFDSFMSANDSDDDIIDNIDRELVQQPLADDSDLVNGDVEFQYVDYIKYEYHTHDPFDDGSVDIITSQFHNGTFYTLNAQDSIASQLDFTASNGDHPAVNVASKGARFTGHRCSRDSLNLEEYSTLNEEVSLLLSEDLDTSWRYVPLYPDNYYSSGEDEQRVSIITDLPNLLRDNQAECMRRVVPKVLEVLQVADTDMQLAAAATFLQILEKDLVTVDEYKNTFLQTILTSVDNKCKEVANAWLDTLLQCIDILPAEIVRKDILSVAVNKGQLCQTVQARVSCCKILGKVSSVCENIVKLRFRAAGDDDDRIKNDILPVALSLCGDAECEVRACMCQRLDIVAHGLGLELTKSKILPQLIELSEDDSQNVICTCLETTVNLIDMLDMEANASAIVPMVKELLEKAFNSVEVTLPVASRLFGQLCHSLLEYMTVEDKTYFLEYYKKLCAVGVPEKRPQNDSTVESMETTEACETRKYTGFETRQNAAYNMPAMVAFLETKLFHLELYSCFSQLCRDPFVPVQKTIAAGFHEIAKLLGTGVVLVFPELNFLLNSTDIEVLKSIVPNFLDIMSPLSDLGIDEFTEEMTFAVQDVVTNFLKAENIVFNSPCWRTQEAMMKSMQCLHHLCRNEYIYHKVIPLLFDKLRTSRALPVKVTAAMTVTQLCRHLRHKAQREELVQTLIEEFCQSKSCYQRSLFVDLAHCYLHVNSRKAFKDNLLTHLLNMMSDPVVTVRLKVLTIFLDMKHCLTLPEDQTLSLALDSALQQLITQDKDNDVQHIAHKISEALAASHHRSENTVLDNKTITAEEEEDMKKEDEEKKILDREEKERRDEETRSIKNTDKRNSLGAIKKDGQSKIPGSKKNISLLKASSFGGSKRDDLQSSPKLDTVTIVTSENNSNKGVNGIPCHKQRILCLTKSKSTTCIPSLIPRLEQRPSTPPKKGFVRRIPVLIANKTVSVPVLPGSSANKKSMSPTPSKKSQICLVAQSSATTTVSATRNGSFNNLSPVKQNLVSTVNLASSPVKTVTPATKLNTTITGVTTKVPKKLTKKQTQGES